MTRWCERLLPGRRFFTALLHQFLRELLKLDLHVVVERAFLFICGSLQFLVDPIGDAPYSNVWHRFSIHTKCSHCQINMLTM